MQQSTTVPFSPGIDSTYSGRREAFGYVKVVESIKSISKDPNDRSDSKMGPTALSNNLRKASESAVLPPPSQY